MSGASSTGLSSPASVPAGAEPSREISSEVSRATELDWETEDTSRLLGVGATSPSSPSSCATPSSAVSWTTAAKSAELTRSSSSLKSSSNRATNVGFVSAAAPSEPVTDGHDRAVASLGSRNFRNGCAAAAVGDSESDRSGVSIVSRIARKSSSSFACGISALTSTSRKCAKTALSMCLMRAPTPSRMKNRVSDKNLDSSSEV
eukprot:Amastigsp_a176007_51.p2 type:complete len:203 gc:universal Amastigsp_a176007_51:153-761(+)